jgi:hypothetical protein
VKEKKEWKLDRVHLYEYGWMDDDEGMGSKIGPKEYSLCCTRVVQEWLDSFRILHNAYAACDWNSARKKGSRFFATWVVSVGRLILAGCYAMELLYGNVKDVRVTRCAKSMYHDFNINGKASEMRNLYSQYCSILSLQYRKSDRGIS